MESFQKICPLFYKQVIALNPRRIKDTFSVVFSKFSQIALVASRLGQFCENFENTRENLSLILLGLMRLHILKHRKETTLHKQKICLEKHLFAWESKIHLVAASRKNLYSEAIPFDRENLIQLSKEHLKKIIGILPIKQFL